MDTAMVTVMKPEKRRANRKSKIKSSFISTGRYKNNIDFIYKSCTYLVEFIQ